jgi:hypothetical protein
MIFLKEGRPKRRVNLGESEKLRESPEKTKGF